MTDGEALLAGIIENPHDDFPRLVFADWLDENGQWERAEHIRQELGRQGDYARIGPQNRWSDSLTSLTGCRIANDARDLGWGWEWHRGFIREVKCPTAEWLRCGHVIARAHPLERVLLTDKDPYPPSREQRVCWFHPEVPSSGVDDNDHSRLPVALLSLLDGHDNRGASPERVKWYADRRAANVALSSACILWARLPEDQR